MPVKLQTISVVIPFGSLNATYTPITPAGFTVYQINVTNTTNQDIVISYDKVASNIYVPTSGQYFTIPPGVNAAFPPQLYIKYVVAPASGHVVIQFTGAAKAVYDDPWA